MFIKNKNAQGAIEYLLIIGGALLIAVIALAIIVGVGSGNRKNVEDSQQGYQELVDNQVVSPIINDVECSTSIITIYTAGSPTKGVSNYKISLDGNAYELVTTIDLDNRVITYNKVSVPGTKYTVRLVSIKNNLRSTPTLPFDCIVK